ncbi:hypothetical protein Hanom_Chr09g00826481 [Helianthus anomalus]
MFLTKFTKIMTRTSGSSEIIRNNITFFLDTFSRSRCYTNGIPPGFGVTKIRTATKTYGFPSLLSIFGGFFACSIH